ncbi:prepilin peptidase [Trichothermofontia sp.]
MFVSLLDLVIAIIYTLAVLAMGAAVGSFLNVVVYRLPAGLSLLWPPSRCPHCLHRLSAIDNVPVFGWLWLRGRCRYCRAPIAVRYPIVEALMGCLFLVLFWQFGQTWQTVAAWVLASWLMALSLIDLDTMTLPNTLTQSGLLVGLGFQGVLGVQAEAVAGVAPVIQAVMEGIIGMVVGIWLFDTMTNLGSIIFQQTVMGGGDAKLAAMLGAWLGWQQLLLAVFLACALGAFVGGTAIALGWVERRQPIPFGPFLALGGLIALVWGKAMVDLYVRFFFPAMGG